MTNSAKEILQHLRSKPKHGGALDDMLKTANDLISALESTLTGATATQAGIGALIGANQKLGDTLTETAKKTTFLEQRYSVLNKTFGISSQAAATFGIQLDKLSDTLKVGGVTAIKYAQNLNNIQAGLIANGKPIDDFRKRLLMAQRVMVTNLGVTEKAAEGYEYYASTIAESGLDQLAMQQGISDIIEKNSGLTGVQRDLTEEIGNLTADLQMRYSKIPGSLELAILKSRALGMSMADLSKAGDNLLNIESSIGDELEYQLLTGRRLLDDDGQSLTNAYREAAIQGDANKQAELMNRILETEGETLQNNLFARQQMAKLLGTDEATLARSIQKRTMLQKLGAEELMNLSGDQLESAMKKLQEDVKSDPDRTKIYEQLIKASDTRTTDEMMLEEIQMLNSNIIGALVGGSGKTAASIVSDTRSTAMDAMIEPLKTLSGTLSDQNPKLIGALQLAASSTTALVSTIKDLGTALVQGNLDQWVKNPEVATTTQKDALIMNDGLIQFHPSDKFMKVNDSTMIAGTNIDGNKKLASAISNGGGITDAQINKLANTIATAVANSMKGVTIKADPLYTRTSLNGDRFA